MYRFAIAALIVLLALPAFAADKPLTEEQKTFYAVGYAVARQLSVFNFSPAEFDIVKQGLADGMAGTDPLADPDAYRKKTQELAIARRDAQGEKLAAATKEYLDKAAKEKGAVKTASGLIYLSLKEGSGTGPTAASRVKVNYRGTYVDGKEFDNTYKRDQPVELQLSSLMKCWTEGVPMMKPGGKARLVCPPEIAYGKNGSGIIPANAALVFEIELLEVMK